MEEPRRLTEEELLHRKKSLDSYYERIANDPERIEPKQEVRKIFKELFNGDLDALLDFTAELMIQSDHLAEENEELTRTVKAIHRTSYGLRATTKIPVHVKCNLAHLTLEGDPEDPASLAFLCGLDESRRLQAQRNALKGHEKRAEARQFVKDVWSKQKDDYSGNKSEFSRVHVRLVKIKFGVTITEKQMREVWLSDTRGSS